MYKALVTFCGIISMAKGDVAEIADKAVANDLLKAGYIKEVQSAPKPTKAKRGNQANKKGV